MQHCSVFSYFTMRKRRCCLFVQKKNKLQCTLGKAGQESCIIENSCGKTISTHTRYATDFFDPSVVLASHIHKTTEHFRYFFRGACYTQKDPACVLYTERPVISKHPPPPALLPADYASSIFHRQFHDLFIFSEMTYNMIQDCIYSLTTTTAENEKTNAGYPMCTFLSEMKLPFV